MDTQQLSVRREINSSDAPLMFTTALAGVGKTTVISALLYAAIQSYCRNNEMDLNKVVLILLPSRELREDLARGIVGNVFKQEVVLWLGRPPKTPGLGMWDDLLQEGIRARQADTWNALGRLKTGFRSS